MEARELTPAQEDARATILHDYDLSALVERLILEGHFDHVLTKRAHDLGWIPPLTDYEIMRMTEREGEE